MSVFDLDSYECQRKLLALTGQIHVRGPAGGVEAYSKQKALKLREDIGVFTDESQSTPLFFIKARQIFDFAATFDIRTPDGTQVGALRRKALKSLVKDEWLVLGTGDKEVGLLAEEGGGLAVIRRFIPFGTLFFAQEYSLTLDGTRVAGFRRNRNPVVSKLAATLVPPLTKDQRILVLAAAVLMLIVEEKEG